MTLNHSHGSPTNFRNERRKAANKIKRSRKYRERAAKLNLGCEQLEERAMMFAPQLIAINPNSGAVLKTDGTDVRNVAPTDLTFRFDQSQTIDRTTLAAGISIVRTGGAGDPFGPSGAKADVVVVPGFLDLGTTPNEVVFRFAEALPDDTYQIIVSPQLKNALGEAFDANANLTGNQSFTTTFRLDLGAKVTAVVPQPVDRVGSALSARRNQIDVYFNSNDPLNIASAQTPGFYQLIFTKDTVDSSDDKVFLPTSVSYSQATGKATLTFASDLSTLAVSAGSTSGLGTFRLRIGTTETQVSAANQMPVVSSLVPDTQDPGDTYTGATPIGSLSGVTTGNDLAALAAASQGLVIHSAIDPQVFTLDLPGGDDEPGHRDIDIQDHLAGNEADASVGITKQFYNFQFDLGGGKTNGITAAQKQRAREIFQLYSYYSGIQFVETVNQGFTIVTGDPHIVNPFIDTGPATGNGPTRFVTGGGMLVMDAAESWNDQFGGNWFIDAMRGIGQLLGLGETDGLPPTTVMGADAGLAFDNPTEPIFPGDADIEHLMNLYRPEGKDIDLYKFTVSSPGQLSAETVAERRLDSSLLNSALNLYKEEVDPTTGALVRTLIARNDDYFSSDSFMNLTLDAGTYYIGVSASGDTSYDPTIPDTGFGGTSEGAYDLRLNFRPNVNISITDTTGTALDGDADGNPGGVDDFWFRTAPDTASTATNQTIYVDKIASATGANGTLAHPFNNIPAALTAAQNLVTTGRTNGSLKEGEGPIVRIVGNGIVDGNPATTDTAQAYEIGVNPLNSSQSLADGFVVDVPRDVTVMVDAGALFKLRKGRFIAGSSSPAVNHSGATLQILGTPNASVFFTSYDDLTLGTAGTNVNPSSSGPQPNQWGGITFEADLDKADGRFDFEKQGVFLNYVNHADMRYGGGLVNTSSGNQVITPVQMIQSRPTVTFNTITFSADAAMSADPDSFEETNFSTPPYQISAQNNGFFLDYNRVGPEIHGNHLVTNSINGLSISIRTPAGTSLRPMTVAGRFNDTDIVHVINDNLIVANTVSTNPLTLGTPGGPMLETVPLPVGLVILTAQNPSPIAGTLAASHAYSYKLTLVDRAGNESAPSSATGALNLTAPNNAIQLSQLPTPTSAQAAAGFVGRRLYRSIDGGAFTLAAQLNSTDTTFVDRGATLGGTLHGDPALNISSLGIAKVAVPTGLINAGTYFYKVVLIDQNGNENTPSAPTAGTTISAADVTAGLRTIEITNFPVPTTAQIADGFYGGYRIYRSTTVNGTYSLVGQIKVTDTKFDDILSAGGSALLTQAQLYRPRLDASLVVDPGVIIKSQNARIEAGVGSTIIAEGVAGQPVVFTSLRDDRYGGGGTFDTNNNGTSTISPIGPAAGNWAGIFAGPTSTLSLDHVVVAYGGGTAGVGGSFRGFNAVEIDEAQARIAESEFEFNADGTDGQAPADRFGYGFNGPATIFVRGAQPIIVDNKLHDNNTHLVNNLVTTISASQQQLKEAVISINANALNNLIVTDYGRSTGLAATFPQFVDNQGPLIRLNTFDRDGLNGMVVRGQTLTTESDWDDTDIVHILFSTIYVPDFHTFGNLRLKSSASESLVVKLLNVANGPQGGLVATGLPLDISDRIGGSVQVLGQPGFPVVLTSLNDDTVGAGFNQDGTPQNDTNGDGIFSQGSSTSGSSTGPITVTPTTNGNLLRDTLLGSGITPVGNAVLVGGTASAGIFTGGADSVGIGTGILLTTGDALNAAGPNASDGSSGIASGAGDSQLDSTFSVTTEDTTSLQFDFISTGGNLFFNFVFASDEYNEFVNDVFNDVFAFYIDGQNIALIPSTATPVSINTVNGGNPLGTGATNPQFYVNNDPSDGGLFLADCGYDGFTKVFTATKLGLSPGTHTIKLAISDVGDESLDSGVFIQAQSFSDVQTSPVAIPGGGDWQGIKLDSFSNDRNVEVSTETEPATLTAPGNNSTVSQSQQLGSLAPNVNSGDDVLRLGYEVHGFLSASNDVDVYSFKAKPGTEVWIDADHTTQSLDMMLELLDADGNILALSDDSETESIGTGGPFSTQQFASGPIAFRMQKTPPFQGDDLYSINPRDPGLRITLPAVGALDELQPYFIRVRSNPSTAGKPNPSNPNGVLVGTSPSPDNTPDLFSLNLTVGALGGAAGGISDGQTFTVSSAGFSQVFEFDNGTGPTVDSNHVAIGFTAASTADQIAQAIVDAIANAGSLQLSPVAVAGTGRVELGNGASLNVNVDLGNPGSLTRTGGLNYGLTKGAYQFQVRLQEADEVPGSTVRLSTIKFANVGIDVAGLPGHSPLLGEAAEVNGNNSAPGTPAVINLGNLLNSDQATLSVSGNLSNFADVDFYQFQVSYDNASLVNGTPRDLANHVLSTIFDMDYSGDNSLARPDTYLAIFDSAGRLILTSSDIHSIADDQGSPLSTNPFSDLGAGSDNTVDPFLGAINLIPGTYFVAVASNVNRPTELSGANGLLRLEPVNSVVRVVEDHLDAAPNVVANSPNVSNLFNTAGNNANGVSQSNNVIPYTLGDVQLFVSQEMTDAGNGLGTRLLAVDPFTGRVNTVINQGTAGASSFGLDVGDIALRSDGNLFAFTTDLDDRSLAPNFFPSDATSGNYLQINTGTGAATNLGDDGIVTYEQDPTTAANTPVVGNPDPNLPNAPRVGYGVDFYATAFGTVDGFGGERLLAIGSRGDGLQPTGVTPGFVNAATQANRVALKQNILYRFDPNTGLALNNPGTPTIVDGDRATSNILSSAGTDAVEVGEVTTAPRITILQPATNFVAATDSTTPVYKDGLTFTVDDGVNQSTFEFDSGPEVRQVISAAQQSTIHDGNFFTTTTGTGASAVTRLFQLDTGPSFVVNVDGGTMVPGTSVTMNSTVYIYQFVDPVTGDKFPPSLPNGVVAVQYNGSFTSASLAAALATAIGAPAGAFSNRVALPQASTATASADNSVTVEGSFGNAPIIQVRDSSKIVDNTRFSVNLGGQVFTFVFDLDGAFTAPAPNEAIVDLTTTTGGFTQTAGVLDAGQENQVAQAIFNAASTFDPSIQPLLTAQLGGTSGTAGPSPLGNKVVLNGQGVVATLVAPTTVNPAAVNLATIDKLITGVFEDLTDDQIGQIVATSVNAFYQGNTTVAVNASASGSRINFPDAEDAHFGNSLFGDNGVPAWFDQNVKFGVQAGNIRIPFQVADTAADQSAAFPNPVDSIVERMVTAINGALNDPADPDSIQAFGSGNTVRLNRGSIILPTSLPSPTPFRATGNGPGGIITGMAILPDNGPGTQTLPIGQANESDSGVIYAVSDTGGLFRVTAPLDNFNNPENGISTQYIATSEADLLGIRFAGLTKGPQIVENGRYQNLLFGIDQGGRLYCFNTAGVLQPIFVNGQTSVQLPGLADSNGRVRVNGLAFSNLEQNLWNFTPSVDPLGLNRQRQNDPGHGVSAAPSVDPARGSSAGGSTLMFGLGLNAAGVPITYNYAGGAYGTVISNEFSLKDYAASDQPNFYFTSRLDDGSDLDALKVYITSDEAPLNGDWQLLTTSPAPNVNGFRQSRISLANFVGLEHLKLRFDFSTAGDMDVGVTNSTGDQLWAVPGAQIRDGDIFTIDGNNFEFEMGITFTPPTASALLPGDGFSVNGTTTFEFTKPGAGTTLGAGTVPIPIGNDFTSEDVARAIVTALNGSTPAVLTQRNPTVTPNRVELQNPTAFTLISTSSNPAWLDGRSLPLPPLPAPQVRPGVVDGSVGVAVGNVPVPIHLNMDRFQVAGVIDPLLETVLYKQALAATGNGASFGVEVGPAASAASHLGDNGRTFTLSDGLNTVNFELDHGIILQVPADTLLPSPIAAGAKIADGDTFTIQAGAVPNPATDVTFEFDKNNTFTAGRVQIKILDTSSQVTVATAIRNALQTATVTAPHAAKLTAMGIVPALAGAGQVRLLGNSSNVRLVFTQTVSTLTQFGTPGVTAGNVRVVYNPNVSFTAANMATAIQQAYTTAAGNAQLTAMRANHTAAVVTGATSRVTFTKVGTLGPTVPQLVISFPPPFPVTPNSLLKFDAPNNISKQQRDLLEIIGHSVTNAGPLNFDPALQGDLAPGNAFTDVPNLRVGENSPVRGQNNAFEGAYLDDFIVGAAERGEIATNANANAAFTNNLPTNEILEGLYQLEIRRGPNYTGRSFNTDDRLTHSFVFTGIRGSDLIEGQSFTISDGVHEVRFEFDDTTLTGLTGGGNGVQQGSIRIPFFPGTAFVDGDTDYQVAARVVAAINSDDVQQILHVTAALADGTQVNLGNTPLTIANTNAIVAAAGTTNANVNLFGAATVLTIDHVNVPEGSQNTNDFTDRSNNTRAQATDTNISATRPARVYRASANIGDGDKVVGGVTVPDVDFYKFVLLPGETVKIDIDSDELGSRLDSVLDLFDSSGNLTTGTGTLVANNNDGQAPGEDPSNDSYLEFTAPLSTPAAGGTFYLRVRDGGAFGGDYLLTVSVGAPGFIIDDDFSTLNINGDQNNVRQQGQVILQQNTITDSATFGIRSQAGTRGTTLAPLAGLLPHQGSVRNLPKENSQLLAPGLVIENNLIVGSGTAGVFFAGDSAAGPTGAVPFGRIVNNTIFGSGGTLIPKSGANDVGIAVGVNAGPTLLNNLIANAKTGITVDASSNATTVIAGNLYQGNGVNSTAAVGLGDNALPIPLTTQVFVDAANRNFYPSPQSPAIDSAIDSQNDRGDPASNQPGIQSVRDSIGVPSSPILAPDTDLTGQNRVDVKDINDNGGSGGNPFKDRGAIDRADFDGPQAILLNPLDNGTNPLDKEPALTIVRLDPAIQDDPTTALTNFAIQLRDGTDPLNPLEGSGVDNSTVTSDKVTLTFNGALLKQGIDYTLNYDTTNHILRIVPLTGIWLKGNYVINLDNSPFRFLTDPLAGTQIVDGQTFSLTDNASPKKTVTFEFDNGFNFQVPAAGGGAGGITDGQRFTITNSATSTTKTFEFDDGSGPALAAGIIGIPFVSGASPSTADTIANNIVTAVKGVAGLGLTGPTAPVNVGGGRVVLGGIAGTHTVVAGPGGTTPTFSIIGKPGKNAAGSGNIVIPVLPGMTTVQVATAMVAAINGSSLSGVTASIFNSDQVIIRNANTLTGLTFTQGGIKDLAGNNLKANQLDGTLRFTILISEPLDFGDAPDTFKTLLTSNGPRHLVVNGYSLGPTITTDADGTPTANAASDAGDDGITITSSPGGNFIQAAGPNPTTASFNFNLHVGTAGVTPQTGVVNGWIDFNQDGVFQANEQIKDKATGSVNFLLNPGDNSFTVDIPAETPTGGVVLLKPGTNAIARFRLSSTGNLPPTGRANDGEVEDYQFTILTGFPFRNQQNLVLKNKSVGQLDVNNDGHVDGRDAFTIISAYRLLQAKSPPDGLDALGGRSLPHPALPGAFPNNPFPIAPNPAFFFVDTSGPGGFSDNRFDPLDIAAVITQIIANPFGEAESINFSSGGEGEASYAPAAFNVPPSGTATSAPAAQTAISLPENATVAVPEATPSLVKPAASSFVPAIMATSGSITASPDVLSPSLIPNTGVEIASGAVGRLTVPMLSNVASPIATSLDLALADIAGEVGDEWKLQQAVDSLFSDPAALLPDAVVATRLPLARGRS